MSVFRDRPIPCPRCGAVAERYVAISLNAPRVPHVRAAILDGSFQRFTCGKCGGLFVVDGPLVWLDFPNKRWIMLFPGAWESSWRALEDEPVRGHLEAMVENAPEIVRAQAEGYTLRTVFGCRQLRDKLRALEAGLDDVALEALKVRLARETSGLRLHPDARFELVAASGDRLRLESADAELETTRAAVEETARAPEWAPLREAVSGGPYVDVGRMLIAGEEPRPSWTSNR